MSLYIIFLGAAVSGAGLCDPRPGGLQPPPDQDRERPDLRHLRGRHDRHRRLHHERHHRAATRGLHQAGDFLNVNR